MVGERCCPLFLLPQLFTSPLNCQTAPKSGGLDCYLVGLGGLFGTSLGYLGPLEGHLGPLEGHLAQLGGLVVPVKAAKSKKHCKIQVKVHLEATTPARDASEVGFVR